MLKKHIKLNNIKRVKDPFIIKSGNLSVGSISSSQKNNWAEDVYMSTNDNLETLGKNFNYSRIPFFVFLISFFLLILLGRLIYLQIIEGDYYRSIADVNRVRVTRVEPKRGIVYDRNHQALLRNSANFIIYAIPVDLPEDDNELNKILDIIGNILINFDKNEFKNKIEKIDRYSLEAYSPVFIIDNIEYEKAMLLYLKSEDLPGIILSTKTKRNYLFSGVSYYLDEEEKDLETYLSLSHILGYTGKINAQELANYGDEYLQIDYIGKMGIEYFWENELKGKNGEKKIEVDALGKEKKIISQKDAIDGNNLLLSIDLEQQNKLEEILTKHLKKINLQKASAIVMDPNNGEILALVSLPAYNNNFFASGISGEEYDKLIKDENRPLFNRAISGEFPSGSTFKPIISAAALEEKVISEDTAFLSTGGLRISQWFFPDWKAGGHGMTNIRKAIAESVNTFYYYIGGGYEDFVGLGVERIVDYAKKFGLGTQTGIDLPAEADGFLPSKEWKKETKNENWYIGDTYHLAIGQGDLLTTPLQVALFTSIFANKGSFYRPHIVKQILSDEDKLIRDIVEPPVDKNFISDYNINVVREGMRQTITSGSARSLSALPVSVAGKTGTAQWSSQKENHAWFTCFAPYEKAEIVLTILIEEGKEGSSVAVPIAKEYLEWYFKY